MAVGDVHIAGDGGWALCGASGPVNGYSATSQACRECESLDWDRRHGVVESAAASTAVQPRTFRVVTPLNGYGLSRDADIMSDAFHAAGWRRADGRVAANIHLERVDPHALATAKHNIVIPNPEWWCQVGNISVEDLNNALLHPSTRVWAKTADAEQIFTRFGARVERIGFRSADRYYPRIERERTFLHIAGQGPNKRTERLWQLWRQEWPHLTITYSGHLHFHSKPNVTVISHRIEDGELRALQNRNVFHIYPSRYEGFGHAQWEGISCGACVLVCDGPPFDEYGDLFGLMPSSPYGSCDWNQGILWRDVDESALAVTVAWAQKLSDEALVLARESTRMTWEHADRAFTERVQSAITAIDDVEASS